jgi:predicted DNA-binding transcriptional regulator YafY
LNQKPAERRVDPYAVHLHNGTLYLIGYCHMRKAIRSFVVDRMQKIKIAEESFTPTASGSFGRNWPV